MTSDERPMSEEAKNNSVDGKAAETVPAKGVGQPTDATKVASTGTCPDLVGRSTPAGGHLPALPGQVPAAATEQSRRSPNASGQAPTAATAGGVGGEDAAATTGAGGAHKAQVFKKPADVPGDLLKLIDDLLVDGATFEDVVESVEEQEPGRLPLHVVATYFRSNMHLQKRRVLRQVEKAQELKKSLGDPASAEAKLADAIFMTGYMGVTRKGAEIKLKDIESIRLGKENLRLRNRVLRHRQKENRQQRRYRRLREDVMKKKLEFYKLKTAALKKAMAAESKQNKLGPETMRAIQEIYGIATIPSLPAEIR
ncbi:MAG: hypothetical protein HYS33_03720 [Acidobacteria bacterium]|nr:hypothetical protein [Acidobacteriota bacterium]